MSATTSRPGHIGPRKDPAVARALGVAAGRAAETESDNPLISDPYARIFLDVVGDGIWNWFATPDLPDEQ